MFLIVILIFQCFCEIKTISQCSISVTTASRPAGVPLRSFTPGTLIFEDNFDNFDFIQWSHALSLSGSGVGIKLFIIFSQIIKNS